VIGVAIVLALVLVGFAALSRRSLNVDGAPAAARPAVAAAQPMATPMSGTSSPQPAAADAPVAGGAAGDETAGPAAVASPVPTQTAEAGQPALPSTAAAAGDRAPRAATPARAMPQRLAGVVRYTKYAKTMRLFCRRSGRHTPQCHVFNASLANAGR
jgi:hypothetical protein